VGDREYADAAMPEKREGGVVQCKVHESNSKEMRPAEHMNHNILEASFDVMQPA